MVSKVVGVVLNDVRKKGDDVGLGLMGCFLGLKEMFLMLSFRDGEENMGGLFKGLFMLCWER